MLAVFIAASACSGKHDRSEMLVHANQMHMASLNIYNDASLRLLRVRHDTLLKQNNVLASQADSLNGLLEIWEKDVIEVPGCEHKHQHIRNFSHEHKTAPQMTEESMLEYQKEALAAIQELRTEVMRFIFKNELKIDTAKAKTLN